MIKVGNYLRNVLNKRNMTQKELVKEMERKGFKGVHYQHIGNLINGTDEEIRYSLMRKIEITLNLPEFTLINMAGRPSEFKIKQLKEIK